VIVGADISTGIFSTCGRSWTIGILMDALPSDSSYAIRCNAVPDMEEDCFTFHDAAGEKSGSWARTGNGQANTYSPYTKLETFTRDNNFDGLRGAMQAGLAPDYRMAP
jgi:hypothetical protein